MDDGSHVSGVIHGAVRCEMRHGNEEEKIGPLIKYEEDVVGNEKIS